MVPSVKVHQVLRLFQPLNSPISLKQAFSMTYDSKGVTAPHLLIFLSTLCLTACATQTTFGRFCNKNIYYFVYLGRYIKLYSLPLVKWLIEKGMYTRKLPVPWIPMTTVSFSIIVLHASSYHSYLLNPKSSMTCSCISWKSIEFPQTNQNLFACSHSNKIPSRRVYLVMY